MKFRFVIILLILEFFLLSFTDVVKEENSGINDAYQKGTTPKLSDKDFKQMFTEAQELCDYQYYEEAMAIFVKLLASDNNNNNINFYMGVCYLNLKKQTTKTIAYFEKAILKTDVDYSYSYKETAAPVFAFLYLGQAYCLAGRYTDALTEFNKFKSFLTDKNKFAKFLTEVDRDIEMANNAIKYTATPVKVKIEPFKIVNSLYSDYSPILTSNGHTLYFTSKRKGSLGGQKDNLGEFFDDIYLTSQKNKIWVKPKKIGGKINSVNKDVLNCISSDGSQLYFSRQLSSSFDIYVATLSKKGKWSVPKKLDKTINSKYNETCAFISSDTSYLLFASDRPGGYGGYDIYISQKTESGEWGKPKNMGPEVNTAYDDMWPVLMADGTLYFSSKGHESMGGFDIFKCKIQDDSTWTDPVNMGYPLNTPYDDISFSPTSADGKTGYYSSARAGGFGDAEIYEYTFQ